MGCISIIILNKFIPFFNLQSSDSEILLESFSDEDESAGENAANNNDAVNKLSDIIKNNSDKNCEKNNESASEIRRLLRRKDELLRKQKMQEKYTQRLQVGTHNNDLIHIIYVRMA